MDERTYQIIWSPEASEDFNNVLNYLFYNWPQKVLENFIDITDHKLGILKTQPYLGFASEKDKAIRSILLTKHNRIYYEIKDNTVEILNIIDTRKNPKKNPY